MVASQLGGRVLDKRDARPALLLGSAVGAAGFALWAARMTDLSFAERWPYVVLSGTGIGFLLAPASADAVNRAIDASYGEVTGITRTVRSSSAPGPIRARGSRGRGLTEDDPVGGW